MTIKVWRYVQRALEIAVKPPPPKPRAPVVRRPSEGSKDEMERWVAAVADDLFESGWVAAPSRVCGSRHTRVFDPTTQTMICQVCKTEFAQVVKHK